MLENINYDLYPVYLFTKVYELKSMTKVAEKLYLTQPGVSQHIKSLENQLEIELFIRDGKKLIPTKSADLFYRTSKKFLDNYSSDLSSNFAEKTRAPEGHFVIGIPIEFGNREVIPCLARMSQQYKKLSFQVVYGFSSDFHLLLEKNDLDVAFMDDYPIDKKKYISRQIRQENLVLCIHKSEYQDILDEKKSLDQFNLIAYDQNGSILKKWKSPQFKKKLNFRNIKFVCPNARGVGELILHRAGIGILPEEFYHKWKSGDEVQIISSMTKDTKNTINITYLGSRIQDPSFSIFSSCLEESLQKN